MAFLVDIPNSNDPEGSWVNINTFEDKEEMLTFLKETFGADDKGRILLFTEIEDEDNFREVDDDDEF